MKLTDEEIVQKDREALYIGNLNTVESDLSLPSKGKYGSCIRWESEHERYITKTGKITRPSCGMGNRTVKLTAFFVCGNVEEKREFKVTLLENKSEIHIVDVYPIHLKGQVNMRCYLPFYVPVRTETGYFMHEAVWKCGRSFKSKETGTYKVTGYLKGRKQTDQRTRKKAAVSVEAQLYIGEAVHPATYSKKVVSLADHQGRSRVILSGRNEFMGAQTRMLRFLLGIDDDQMLYNFRREAGIDTRGASSMTGWDSPDGLLRGHTTGHYLSALALCFHATGEPCILEKARYMTEELGQCQKALSEDKGYAPGFLSAYSEEQFDLLETYTPYPEIWAPYYTLHKILAGLLDCEKWAGITLALDIADKIGEWIFHRLNRLNQGQRMRMWSIYIAGEFGGINESLAELYLRTDKEIYLRAAKMFDNDRLFLPMEMKMDALDGMHANQHIPQIVGALKIYEASGESRYYDIAKFFWESVTTGHCYAIGGTGETEMFHPRNRIGSYLTENTAESCASYNMLKLTRMLYQYEPSALYMDYYERTMQNHILASLDKAPSGETVYFLPMGPGFSKKFERENTCCHGTGMENHFQYIDSIYYHDQNSLYINLFLESSAYWKEKGIYVKQAVKEERPGEITLCLHREEQKPVSSWNLKIRQPYWCAGLPEVSVNGEKKVCRRQEEGYLQLAVTEKEWKEGRGEISVAVHFPCRLRLESAPDNAGLAALAYGPYILAAISGQRDYLHIPLCQGNLEEIVIPAEEPLVFKYKKLQFIPLYKISEESYHVYFSTIN